MCIQYRCQIIIGLFYCSTHTPLSIIWWMNELLATGSMLLSSNIKKTSHNFFVSFSFFSHIAVSFFVYYETTTEVVVSYYTKNKTNKNPCQISASANSSSPRKITYITWPWLTLSDTLQVGHLAASWARGWVTTYIDYFTVTRILP